MLVPTKFSRSEGEVMPWEVDTKTIVWMKDVVTIVATCAGIYFAASGLSTWKRQMKGQTEYELARRLLRCTYVLRDAIYNVRRPEILAYERVMPDDYSLLTDAQIKYSVMNTAYHNRWEKVTTARAELQSELLESEAVWGRQVGASFELLFQLQQELVSDINAYLVAFDPDESEQSKSAVYKLRLGRRTVNFNLPRDTPDPYQTDVIQAVEIIESLLKPHLAK